MTLWLYDAHTAAGAPGAGFYLDAATFAPGGARTEAVGAPAPVRPVVTTDPSPALGPAAVRAHPYTGALPAVISDQEWLYWRPIDASGRPAGSAAYVHGKGLTPYSAATWLGASKFTGDWP